jgi:hypothetical protein
MHQIYPKSKFFQKIEPFYWSYHLYDTIDNKWETMNFFVVRFYLPRNTQVRFEGILGNEIFASGRFDRTGYGFRTESQIFKQVYVQAAIRSWGAFTTTRTPRTRAMKPASASACGTSPSTSLTST